MNGLRVVLNNVFRTSNCSSMTSSTARTILHPYGIKSFRNFLNAERHALRQSPVLVISSEPAGSQPNLSTVAESCKLVHFTLAQQMGLRTVPSTVLSAFPTMHDLEQKSELIRRTGAASVVAVGSGAACDLGKALANEKELDNLILIPSTYAAVLASSASHSLFLDPDEETLVPLPKDNDTVGTSVCSTTIAPLDLKYIAPVDSSHVLFASLAILLDAVYRKSENPLLPELRKKLNGLLDSPDEEMSHDRAMDLLHDSGRLISYGLGQEDRSTPVALASALIPRMFPHVHILTFLAGLVPGLLHCVDATDEPLVERIRTYPAGMIPQLSVVDDSLKGFSIPDMAISHIQSNQAVWKSLDLPDKALTDILKYSLSD